MTVGFNVKGQLLDIEKRIQKEKEIYLLTLLVNKQVITIKVKKDIYEQLKEQEQMSIIEIPVKMTVYKERIYYYSA